MHDQMTLSAWESFQLSLRQHEYIHVLLHPLPIYGLLMALVALGIALVLRNRQAEVTGLILVVIAAFSIWPVTHYGKSSYDGMYGLISMTDDDDGLKWLKEHRIRAERVQWVFYATGALAVVALALPPFLPRSSRWLLIGTMLASLGAIGAGSWIGYAGGRVKHKEFRYGPPPIHKSVSP